MNEKKYIHEFTLTELRKEIGKRLKTDTDGEYKDVIKLICEEFGITLDDLYSQSRFEEIQLVRNVCYFILHWHLKISSPKTSAILKKKTHAVVFNGCKKIDERISWDTRFKERVYKLIDECKKLTKMNSNKKTHVITLSKKFMKGHPRSGERTEFKKLFTEGNKIHTIRGNYSYWSAKLDSVIAGEGVLSVREWINRPYKDGQKEIEKLSNVGYQSITIDEQGKIFIEGEEISFETFNMLAQNDGLSLQDFKDWFNFDKIIEDKKRFDGIIIHFTDFKY